MAPALAPALILAPLLAGLFPEPAAAGFITCIGSNLAYEQTGDGADLPAGAKCSTWGFCQEPIVSGPTYSLSDPACSPYFGSCAARAVFDVEFPGNHQNNPADIGFT